MVARLLYRDGLMLVIDKPAGIAVHRGPKGGESLEDHFGALRFGLPRAPALAHRLDRDTSGCLVLGRHRKALATLGKLFKTGAVGKTYWAVVEGGPAEDEGRIDLPLGRRDESRGWWMKPDPDGQPAVTTWKVMGRTAPTGQPSGNARAASASPPPVSVASGREGSGSAPRAEEPPPNPPHGSASLRRGREPARRVAPKSNSKQLTWLALEPLTGRTHQLRVHCAAQGLADRRRHDLRQRAARSAGRRCSCTRARSWCRSTRTGTRSRVMAPVPLTCRSASTPAAGRARCFTWWTSRSSPSCVRARCGRARRRRACHR